MVFDGELSELKRLLDHMQRGRLGADAYEIMAEVRQLGGNGHVYLKERRKSVRRLVSEIYSPPRVTAAAKLLPELKCIPGFALDLTVEKASPGDGAQPEAHATCR